MSDHFLQQLKTEIDFIKQHIDKVDRRTINIEELLTRIDFRLSDISTKVDESNSINLTRVKPAAPKKAAPKAKKQAPKKKSPQAPETKDSEAEN